MDWIEYLTLGFIQGLTEFLPISSDGHLTIAQQGFSAIRGSTRSGAEWQFIDVVLHLGTLAAILIHYYKVGATGAKGLLGATDVPPVYRRSAVIRTGLLAVVATLPAVPVGLFLKKFLEGTLEGLVWSGVGFLVTAGVLLLTTKLPGGDKGPSETRWTDALLIGVAQAFAPLPGVSRSGLTIAAALGLGLNRTWAVQFSLLMAVPAILGANVLELRHIHGLAIPKDQVTPLIAATVLAGLVGYLAIVWLVRVVRSGRMWYFSVYLVVLGACVLGWAMARGGSPDVRRPTALDGSVRGRPAGPLAGDDRPRALGPLARPDAPGA